MLDRIVEWLLGYVDFSVIGGSGERLLTLLSRNGVPIRAARRGSDGIVTARCTPGVYPMIRPFARRCQLRTRMIGKHGLPFRMKRLFRRPGLLIGAVLFAAWPNFAGANGLPCRTWAVCEK